MSMFSGVSSAIGSAVGSMASGLFGGGSSPDMSGIISDASMKQSLSQSPVSDSAGISSVTQGSNPPPPGASSGATLSGSQAPKQSISDLAVDTGKKILTGAMSGAGDEATNALLQHVFHRDDATKAGKNARDYMAAAFPDLNPWERSGAGAGMSGIQEQQFGQQKQLTKMQLDNQKDIAKMQMDNQLKIAGIGSVTSRLNTADQVYAQNSMLDNNKRESNARISNILASADLSVSQKAETIARIIKTNFESQGVALNNSQIPVLTNEIKARINNINANTSNAKGAKSWPGQVWSDFKNEGPSAPKSAFDILFPDYEKSPVHTVIQKASDMYHSAVGVQGSMSRK